MSTPLIGCKSVILHEKKKKKKIFLPLQTEDHSSLFFTSSAVG